MLNNNDVSKKYHELEQDNKDIHLLPLANVRKLEYNKKIFIKEYLRKIHKIDAQFKIISDDFITLDQLIGVGEEYFGDLSFVDKRNQDFTTEIVLAFSFGIVNLKYSKEKAFSFLINIFWDK